MANLQVTCVNRNISLDPDSRLSYVGGVYNDIRWKHSVFDVVFHLEMTIHSYYIMEEDQMLELKIASTNGRKYLKTKADALHPESLLSLPECPA